MAVRKRTQRRHSRQSIAKESGADICRRLMVPDATLKAELMYGVLAMAEQLRRLGHDDDENNPALTRAFVCADFTFHDDRSDPGPVIALALSGSFPLSRVTQLARDRLDTLSGG